MLAILSSRGKIFLLLSILFLLFVFLQGCHEAEADELENKLELAEQYIMEEEYEQAILAYDEAIEIEPKDERAYIGLSEVYRAKDEEESAEEALKEGIEAVPYKSNLHLELAGLYTYMERHEDAESLYLDVLEEAQDYQRVYEGLAEVYNALEDTENLILIMEQAVEENPEEVDNYTMLARAYRQDGLEREALEMIKEALELDTDHYDAYEVLGNLYGEDWEKLIAEGESILEESPDDSVGMMLKYYGFFNTGSYEEAIEIYEDLYDATESDKATIIAALSYHRTGEIEKGEELIELIDIEDLEHPGILLNLVEYFRETGDDEKAKELANRALEVDDEPAEFYLVLYEITGEEKYIDKIEMLGRDLDKLFYVQGLEHFKKENFEKALVKHERAIQLNPNEPEYYFERGRAGENIYWEPYDLTGEYGDEGYIERALDDYKTAFNLGLVNAESYDSIARVYNNLGQDEEALPYIRKAIQIEPSNSSYYNSKSIYLGNIGRYEDVGEHQHLKDSLTKAQSALEKAATDFEKREAFRSIGSAHHGLENLDEAIENYKSSLEYIPEDQPQAKVDIYINKSHVYEQKEEMELALEATQKAVEHAEHDWMIDQAKERLDHLENINGF